MAFKGKNAKKTFSRVQRNKHEFPREVKPEMHEQLLF